MALHLTFYRILALGIRSLTLHKLRSMLTAIGIVLGVASVIVMVAIGEAARFQAVDQIKQLGATNIIVRSVKPTEDTRENTQERLLRYGLTKEDLQRIVTTIPSVVSATPFREFRKDLRFLDRKLEGRVVGVTPNYLALNGLEVSSGRFINHLDDQQFANVAVIAADVAETLFPFSDPIGRSLRVDNTQYYRIVGVTNRRAPSAAIGTSLSAQDYNRDVYIPFMTDKVRFGEILIYQRAGGWEMEQLEITQITVAVDRMEHVKKTSQIIEGLLEQFHDRDDSEITVPLDLLERAQQTQRTFTMVLGSIALVALVVGGIGIMNIMLATVTERTREIGIRRALGAKRLDITWQFLTETIVLSAVGGLVGIGVGLASSYSVTHFIDLPTLIPVWAPVVAWTISVAVGVVFGLYPARRAAMMDPIEALRHE